MYQNGKYEKILLVKKEAEEKFDNILSLYFDEDLLVEKFEHQTPYVKSENNKKDYHTFSLINIGYINGKNDVVELYKFIHPRYAENQQLYFNKRADCMIEWLDHGRVFLYKKVLIGEDDDENQKVKNIKWTLIRRMECLKEDYNYKEFILSLSEDFSYFIDYTDKKEGSSLGEFIIRETFTEDITHKVPIHIMNYKQEPFEMMYKFKWIGNEMLRVLDQYGMESLVDIGQDFMQLEFNQIDNWDP